MKITQYRR